MLQKIFVIYKLICKINAHGSSKHENKMKKMYTINHKELFCLHYFLFKIFCYIQSRHFYEIQLQNSYFNDYYFYKCFYIFFIALFNLQIK